MQNALKKFFTRTDWVLLALCLAASIFGIVMISSATNVSGSGDYVTKQLIGLVAGLVLYVLISFVDMEILAEHTAIIVTAAAVFLASLYFFGIDAGTGNKSWLSVPLIPFYIQPAEYCKVVYIVAVARVTAVYKERINSFPCVLRLAFLAALFMGLILFISKDAGVMLIYVFITATMALSAGFSFLWFLGAAAAVAVVTPIVWNSSLIATYQKNRILAVFDPSIDPKGTDIRYQTQRSLNAISGGGLTGQGLYQGTKTQANAIPAQHTDFIFAVIGEELGFLGCVAVMLLLAAIILRILYIGAKSQSYFHRQICVGIAGMLLFQVIINIGMCVGVMPVIGITLPFISYGGSSMLSLFIAMGVVSSVKLYPSPDSQQRYIQLPV
jgi:rod shape determining protein RodA